MPVEGVDTFSRLCVPDLECAISGAADDDVVSHLRRPYAARVAHQGAQTLKRPQKKKSPGQCFPGERRCFISNLLRLRSSLNSFPWKGPTYRTHPRLRSRRFNSLLIATVIESDR